MANKGPMKRSQSSNPTRLKKGDSVMIIAGGNKKTRPVRGQVGKIMRFVGRDRQRAVVEGINMVTRHMRSKTPGTPSGRIQKEAPIHVSRLMYYVEKLKKPVRLRGEVLADGRRVRGYRDPESKKFVQIAE